MTVKEAAAFLGVSPKTLRNWDRTDKLKAGRRAALPGVRPRPTSNKGAGHCTTKVLPMSLPTLCEPRD